MHKDKDEYMLELLSDQEESFAHVVAAVEDYAIFALDSEGHIRTWNEGARKINGYSKEEVLGQHFSIFYTEFDRAKKHPEFELQQALKSGSYRENGWRIRKDGSIFWTAVTITPINGKHGGFIKVTRDLTEQRNHEAALETARDQALSANQWKSQFVANVTHELRTPLSSLVGLSELLAKDQSLDPEVRSTTETMFESSKLLLNMVNELLDFAKLEAGKMGIEHVPYSLRKLIKSVVKILRHKADEKSLRLSTHISEDVPDTLVGDACKVRQVLMNLIENSIKFTDSGAIEVSAAVTQNHLEVIVTDTGIGIPAEKQQGLFKPFSQVHDSVAKYGGTGLGLSISAQYVHLMGGKIGVISESTRGSTFWFVLPKTETEVGGG